MLGAASALAAFLMYEAALPLIILPVVVVFIRFGTRGALHNLRANAASHVIWLLSAVTYVVYVLIIKNYIPQSYQAKYISLLGRCTRDDCKCPEGGVHHRLPAACSGTAGVTVYRCCLWR